MPAPSGRLGSPAAVISSSLIFSERRNSSSVNVDYPLGRKKVKEDGEREKEEAGARTRAGKLRHFLRDFPNKLHAMC
jgi:hypothetical protein